MDLRILVTLRSLAANVSDREREEVIIVRYERLMAPGGGQKIAQNENIIKLEKFHFVCSNNGHVICLIAD